MHMHLTILKLETTVEPLYKGTLKSNTTLNNNHHYLVKKTTTIENNLRKQSQVP